MQTILESFPSQFNCTTYGIISPDMEFDQKSQIKQELFGFADQVTTLASQLTDIHLQTLIVIESYYKQEGWMPTVRELQEPLEVHSTSAVDYRLDQLRELGLIERNKKYGPQMAITPLGELLLSLVESSLED